ncbi:hypothetical protein C6A37_11950, partial [Desulfobacteraceae bacterium SEEP-SAG9]
LDLAQRFYFKLTELSFVETYGFWASWLFLGILILTIVLAFLKTVEDFWLILIGTVFSIIAYATFIDPLFLSGPFAFFADNFRTVGIHTVTHIKIVSIALVI